MCVTTFWPRFKQSFFHYPITHIIIYTALFWTVAASVALQIWS
ncbi:Uncharacterised protein [Serratia entomophila]|jgi:hypothetical protein|nr:hypothetical protein 158p1_00017 [Serratia entomophila]ULG12842.1 hypothetical protein 376p_00059 [Serratia liquefaciens]ULG13318.1 hypothetical protein AGR96Xp_00064 [Serratia proteamaculans]CAI1204366.1 Uncharacterised protein [Serratia quinivorans]ULG10560.1 hypothetical protein 176p_00017 [Serratia entomophila]